MKDFAKSIRTNNSTVENFSEEDRRIREQMYREQAEKNRKKEIERAKQEVRELEEDILQAEKDLRNQKDPKERMYLETHISRVKKELQRAKKTATGNSDVGNKYEWTTRNGELQYFNYAVPFGGHKKGSVEKTSGGYTGYKTNGSIIISKKEFKTEEEAKKYVENSEVGNSSHTKEEAKTKDEYFKILKFYQTQGYRTKAGEYNPDGRIKLHKGDDSVEIVLVGNSKVGNEYKPDIRITPADLSRKLKQAKNISEIDDIDDEIEYDLREYENAIDECKLKIKDYERSMSALRMIQRDVSDARRNLK